MHIPWLFGDSFMVAWCFHVAASRLFAGCSVLAGDAFGACLIFGFLLVSISLILFAICLMLVTSLSGASLRFV